jgi:hypothetical protein
VPLTFSLFILERTRNLGKFGGIIIRYNSVWGHEGRENSEGVMKGRSIHLQNNVENTNPNQKTKKMKDGYHKCYCSEEQSK